TDAPAERRRWAPEEPQDRAAGRSGRRIVRAADRRKEEGRIPRDENELALEARVPDDPQLVAGDGRVERTRGRPHGEQQPGGKPEHGSPDRSAAVRVSRRISRLLALRGGAMPPGPAPR